jgi:hypothetical protein
LRHWFLTINVNKYFTHDTIERCEGLKYDTEKGVVIDTLVNEHLSFIDYDNLLGISFSMAPEEDQITSTYRNFVQMGIKLMLL